MKVLVVLVLSLLAINAVYGEDLKCYQCEACHDIDNLSAAVVCKADSVTPELPSEWEDPEEETEKPGGENPANSEEDKDPNQEKVVANKFKRAVKAESSYKCFKQLVNWGKGKIIRRGCTKSDEAACKKERNVAECYICDSESCNFANNVPSWTLGSLLLVAVVKMFF